MPEPESKPAEAEYRPQTFLVLSLLWIFPSLGAVWIVIRSARLPAPETVSGEQLQSVPVEIWCAAGLLGLHGLFILLAFLSWKDQKRAQAENGDKPV